MGWAGRILRVDLTEGTCEPEPLRREWAEKYLGQRGLASKYLTEEIDPEVDPFSADNKLIFTTGPLTGTAASTGGRYSVVTKGPLTGAIACSNSGGHFGAELKFAGWDMVIVEGKASEPVYLHIEDDRVRLVPADDLWGQTVWEVEPAIRAAQQDPQLKIASIGPAGERGVMYACVVNDLHRAAGRSGVGAVMGSKNLKAVAVRGTKGVEVRDPEAFIAAARAGKDLLAAHPVTSQGLPTYGTQVLMNIVNESGGLPTRNAREAKFEGASKISGEAMLENRRSDGKPNVITNAACFGCTIACGRVAKMDRSHFTVENRPEYWGASGGLEYEAAWALGAATGVDDLEALTYANYLCNEHGMDSISFGSTVGAAMELFEAGAIGSEQTGELELRFGSAEALVAAVEATVKGEGFGVDLALGSKRLCEKHGSPELSMSVKGQEFPAYDGRSIQGIGLNYATSNRGACHVRGYTISSEILGIPEKTDPMDVEGKAGLVKAFQDITAAVDSSGLCLFTTFAWGLEDIAPQIDAACPGGWTAEKLLEVGERIWNLERRFNLAAGFTKADDTLPKRMLEETVPAGPAEGKVAALEVMLPQYYSARGWSTEGVPEADTLKRLGL